MAGRAGGHPSASISVACTYMPTPTVLKGGVSSGVVAVDDGGGRKEGRKGGMREGGEVVARVPSECRRRPGANILDGYFDRQRYIYITLHLLFQFRIRPFDIVRIDISLIRL